MNKEIENKEEEKTESIADRLQCPRCGKVGLNEEFDGVDMWVSCQCGFDALL